MTGAPSQPPQTVVVSVREMRTNGFGVAGFVISLLAILGFCVGGLAAAPVGLLLSLIGLRKQPRGLAITGTILGFLGSAWLLVAVLVFGGLTLAGASAAAALADAGAVVKIESNVRAFHAIHNRLPADFAELTGAYTDTPTTDRHGRAILFTVVSPSSCRVLLAGADGQVGTPDDLSHDLTIE